jgi:hypothetical protein
MNFLQFCEAPSCKDVNLLAHWIEATPPWTCLRFRPFMNFYSVVLLLHL